MAVWPFLTAIASADAITLPLCNLCAPEAGGRANMNHTGPACTLWLFQFELIWPPLEFMQSRSAVWGPADGMGCTPPTGPVTAGSVATPRGVPWPAPRPWTARGIATATHVAIVVPAAVSRR